MARVNFLRVGWVNIRARVPLVRFGIRMGPGMPNKRKGWWVGLGEHGDSAAARIVLERLCGPVDRAPAVAVNLTAASGAANGPPVPKGKALSEYFAGLQKVAIAHVLVSMNEPVRIKIEGSEPDSETKGDQRRSVQR